MTERGKIRQDPQGWIRVVPDARPDPGVDRLDSWKDIAAYLHRDVSTVQRWEKRQCLPVHRHLHDKQGSVYAFKSELDAWWRQGSPTANVDPPFTRADRWLRNRPAHLTVGLLIVVVTVSAWWLNARRIPQPTGVMRSIIPVTDKFLSGLPSISPDGANLVFIGLPRKGGPGPLYLKPVSELFAKPIPGTEGGAEPFFSPDGNWIGYFANMKLYKVATGGGAPVALASAGGNRGGTWLADDTIVYAPSHLGGLSRIAASGGSPAVLTSPDHGASERTHRWPQAVPGTNVVLFTVQRATDDSYDDADIEAVDTSSGKRQLLVRGGSNPLVAASGHLLYARRGQIWAAPLDVEGMRVTGPGVPVVDGVAYGTATGRMFMTVSNAGTLVYAPGGSLNSRRLLWIDRSGRQWPAFDKSAAFNSPRISPDGRFVALGIDDGTPRVWLLDVERGTLTRRVTGWDAEIPTWFPDGSNLGITQSSHSPEGAQSFNFLAIAPHGTGEPGTIIAKNAQGVDWSPDGSTVAGIGGGDVWLINARTGEVSPFVTGPAEEFGPRFSPDGRWLAYFSNETGRHEVYVLELAGKRRRWQISENGGVYPIWSRDGKELFYRQPASSGVMAVKLALDSDFSPAPAEKLFDGPPGGGGALMWDVGPDGRFIVLDAHRTQGEPGLVMVQNWFEELRRKVPPH